MIRKAAWTVAVLFAVRCEAVHGADWLMVRGDQQHSGFQADEKELNARSVKKLKVLWTRHFAALSDPILLGPIITNRGVKELVFVRDADTVYAVDADLGTVFWRRDLLPSHSDDQQAQCPAASKISPLIHRSSEPLHTAANGDDQYSDGNRPLYVIAADGQVHVLRPSTGGDLVPALSMVPKGALPAGLGEHQDALYAISSGSCGGVPDQVSSRRVGQSGSEVRSIAQSKLPLRNRAVAIFEEAGRRWAIEWKSSDEPVLRLADSGELLLPNLQGVATWQDQSGMRWICIGGGESVLAYRVEDHAGKLGAIAEWRVQDMRDCGAPIVANGIVYFVSRSPGPDGRLRLHAIDARNGAELFQSPEIANELSAGNLALANGHVCFSGSSSTLRCFGIPFTM